MTYLTQSRLASHLAVHSPRNTVKLKQVFQNLDWHSCPTRYNFHMHSVHSDGQLTAQEIVEQVTTIGLKGFAITDHHSVGGFQDAQAQLQHLRQLHPDHAFPHLWTGVEINADLLGAEVHILAYGFNPEHPAMAIYLQGEKVTGNDFTARYTIDAIHQAGGLAILAHPARYRKPFSELIPAAAALNINGTEAFYAYRKGDRWEPSFPQTCEILELNEQYGLLNTCGTDTHGRDLLSRV